MRHPWMRIAAALLPFAAAPGSAGPAAPRTISPVFHQLVAFSLPPPFKAAYEKTTDSFYIREHVPEGETVDEWSKMITLTGAKGLSYSPGASPQAYLQALARGFQRHCPDTYVSLDLGPQPSIPQVSFVTVASCGRVSSGGKAHSETSVMLAIKGSDDYYTLQWTERGRDSSHPLALDSRYWSARLAQLAPVQLCPIVPGEAPPYASCAGH
ncbi:MAG: hypothetical protein ACLPQ6_12305 [Steroidobacteraceae bacterium]|jgi:hypothetical protein